MNRAKRDSKFFGTRKLRAKKRRGASPIKEKISFSSDFVKSRGFFMLLVFFIFILILAFFFGDAGIIEIMKTRSKIEQLKQNVETLEKQKQGLLKEIEELKKNPMSLEKKAREQLWLMKKNEKVVVIVKDKNKDKPQTGETESKK